MSNTILFYRTGDDYGLFSNFSKPGLYVNSVHWPTVEHYFQGQKFHDDALKERIRMLDSPKKAAEMGRDRTRLLRADWDSVKDDIMRFAVLEKFRQNKDAKQLLLSTGDAEIIENTKNDNYWANGGDGSGKNMLGIILMETRQLLRADNQ